MKILLVEDNPELRGMIADHLDGCGFTVDAFATADEGRTAFSLATYDVLLLDLGLPDGDGLDLIGTVAARTDISLPIIVISARGALSSRIEGLNAGADDYLIKPFDLLELQARVHAVLRRPGGRKSGTLSLGDVTFDTRSREAFVRNRPMNLARREAAMLEELLKTAGRVVVRDALEERLYAFNEPVTPNAIEAVVSRLRRKLEIFGSTTRIETKRGIGYRIASEPDETK